MKTGYALLFALLVLGLVPLVSVANAASYYTTVTILGADGGYTSPGPGTYYYPVSATMMYVYAYHYAGYSFAGWIVAGEFWATAYNPIGFSLDIGANVSFSLQPVFSTEPHYVLSLSSNESIYLYVNNKRETILNTTGQILNILGGTTVTVAWSPSELLRFTSYLVNGTDIVTSASFSFIMNGNTSIHVNEDVLTPVSIPTWIGYIAPTAVCLILGYGFSTVGAKIGDHEMAGFFIGGGIGLILCASYSLLPVWLVTVAYIIAMAIGYLWFRGG